MAFLTSLCVSIAILSLGLSIGPKDRRSERKPLLERMLDHSARQLAAARIQSDPGKFLAISALTPPILFGIGWLESPVLAIGAAVGGLLVPRLYLGWLVHAHSRRSEAEAPRLLQALTAGLASGGTYLDALRQARRNCADRWLQDDLDLVIQRFLLDAPLHQGLSDVRARTTTRNLALIWETLRICTEHHLPTERTRELLLELGATVQFNVQLGNEVRARSSGQRAQVWLLAVIVPAMYIYLRLMSPQLVSVLDETIIGRLILFPLAVALEIAGLVLSFRVARIQP
jgi:Flp pilus assembly protein TadB